MILHKTIRKIRTQLYGDSGATRPFLGGSAGSVVVRIAGTGLTFLALAVSLVLNGALVELLVHTGDVNTRLLVKSSSRVVSKQTD